MADQSNSFLGTDEQPLNPPSSDEKMVGMLAHLLGLLTNILAPLVIYLIKKDESAFVAHHAREALNFTITCFIIGFIMVITVIGILFLWVLGLIYAILMIVATIRANEGKLYKYPFSIRLIK